MVEARFLPARRGVADGAILPELPGVRVILPMATVAVLRRPLENVVDVTGFALRFRVPARQREAGQVVVEARFLPARRGMADGAILPELPVVRVVLPVATVAILRRLPQRGDGLHSGVTTVARHRRVFALQRKSHPVVVEGGAVGVQPVVAIEAGRPKRLRVRLGEGGIQCAMARFAIGDVERGEVAVVTTFADEGGPVGAGLVSAQGEADGVMGEVPGVHRRQGGGAPAMFAVAAAAGGGRVRRQQGGVQAGVILYFRGDGSVAVQAAVGHSGRTPWGGMAGSAVAAEVGVAGDAADGRRARFGVQRAGAEDAPAAKQDEAAHHHQRGDGGQNSTAR